MLTNHTGQETPMGFPDLALAQAYATCLLYVQLRLRSLPYGGLKVYTQQHDLTYAAVVTLKNDNLKREEPHLLQRIMRSFGFETSLIRVNTDNRPVSHFIFANSESFELFKHQLASLTSLSERLTS